MKIDLLMRQVVFTLCFKTITLETFANKSLAPKSSLLFHHLTHNIRPYDIFSYWFCVLLKTKLLSSSFQILIQYCKTLTRQKILPFCVHFGDEQDGSSDSQTHSVPSWIFFILVAKSRKVKTKQKEKGFFSLFFPRTSRANLVASY